MKKYFLCILCTIIVPIQIACREQPKYQDDRMVDTPFQDSILDDLIATSMMNSNRKINPDKQIKYYCITFNYFIENDTTKVWVMGNYNHPFVFHDTQGHDIEKFIGYFKRNNTYCFFYQDIFGNKSHANTIEAIQNITKDWEIRKEPEDPIVFPYEIGYQDPWIFGYYIDGDGHYQLYKEGFF